MKRLCVIPVLAVVSLAASLSDSARAQDARPVLFWASIVDPLHPAVPLSYRAVPGTFPAASVAGWMCSASPPHIYNSAGMAGDPEHGVSAVPPSIGQSADLTCTTAGGSVSVTALCMLSSADTSDDGHFTLADAQGHSVELAIHCANNLPASNLAELRALRPGDSLSVPLALHAPRAPRVLSGDVACAPPYTYDPNGVKHFKSECFARALPSEGAGEARCDPPFTFDSQGNKHFKPECL
jgi:hypothetical protein